MIYSSSDVPNDEDVNTGQSMEMESGENQPLLEGRKGEDEETAGKNMKIKGLSTWTAALFLVGFMVGAGVLAFPMALSKSGGLTGLPSLLIILLMGAFCGHLLGQCWLKYNESRIGGKPLRDPYPAVAEFAGGKCLRHTVTIVLNAQVFTALICFLILISEMLQLMIPLHLKHQQSDQKHVQTVNEIRLWLLFTAVSVFPLMLYGTPKDFKFVGHLAAVFSALFNLLIWVKYILIAMDNEKKISVEGKNGGETVTIVSFLSSFGTFIFGSAVVFYVPTVQTDMKVPVKTTKAVLLAFSSACLIFLFTSLGGYMTVNSMMKDNIIDTLVYYDELHGKSDVLMIVCKVAAILHLLCAFVLISNTSSQQLEEALGIPTDFSWKRAATRALFLLSVLAGAEIYPNFAPIISLTGSSLLTLSGYLLPILIYVKLYPERSLRLNVVLCIVGVVSGVGGIAATVACFVEIAQNFKNLYS